MKRQLLQRLSLLLLSATMLVACGSNSRRDEIQARKQALVEHQQKELAKAQKELAAVDSALQAVNAEHDKQHQWVMENATRLKDDAPEVVRLNELRSQRDSLQAQWQTLGAKIRYIRQKQNEYQNNESKTHE